MAVTLDELPRRRPTSSRGMPHLAWTALVICLTGLLLGFDLCIAGSILTPVQRSLKLCFPCPDLSDAGLAQCSCQEKQLAISAVTVGAALGCKKKIWFENPHMIPAIYHFTTDQPSLLAIKPETVEVDPLGKQPLGLILHPSVHFPTTLDIHIFAARVSIQFPGNGERIEQCFKLQAHYVGDDLEGQRF